MQIHLHEVKILQIHNTRPEFVKKKNITAINQSESSIFIWGVINMNISMTWQAIGDILILMTFY